MSKYQYNDTDRYAGFFKALANPHRLKIFLRLVSCCKPGSKFPTEAGMKSCVGDLGKDLGLAPSTISHHIKELHRAGLLRMERSGQHIECWVDEVALAQISGFFKQCGGVVQNVKNLSPLPIVNTGSKA